MYMYVFMYVCMYVCMYRWMDVYDTYWHFDSGHGVLVGVLAQLLELLGATLQNSRRMYDNTVFCVMLEISAGWCVLLRLARSCQRAQQIVWFQ